MNVGWACVLFKRTQCSAFFCIRTLCSFTFFAKEHCILCVLLCSSEKNAKERIILLGLISHQKLEKRTQKNVVCFKRTQKNDAFRT